MEKDSSFKPLISIVVPIFNIEELVFRCVQSLVQQSYRHLEIILVDDGSTDNSGKIVDGIAETDPRIVVIHKINGGLSDARNAGIDRANGELITFIDGDDYATSDYVEILLKQFDDSTVDLSIVNFSKVLPQHKGEEVLLDRVRPSYEVISNEDALHRLFIQDGITNSAWAKLYRLSAFEGIRYPFGKNFEGLPVTYKLFSKARNIGIASDQAYFYVQHPRSITATTKFNERVHAIGFAEEAVEFAKVN